MRILLDTHIYLWCLDNDPRLSKTARKKIMDATEVFVSSASLWEIVIKVKLKKLKANVDELISAMTESGFTELPITSKHVAQVGQLPDVHRDPFDRILIAQMLSEPLRLITKDSLLQHYSELVMLV